MWHQLICKQRRTCLQTNMDDKGSSNDVCCDKKSPEHHKLKELEEKAPESMDEKGQTEIDRNKENHIDITNHPQEEEITFKVIFNRNKYDVSFPLNKTVHDLKAHLQSIIGVPQAMQKVMIKGLAKDDRTLRDLGLVKGAKVMVVGSKLDDVLAVSTPSVSDPVLDAVAGVTNKEPLCKQKIHRKVLDKGLPEDVMPGILNFKQSLPQVPLFGMLNKAGGKVRLTFKLELDQLWIGSKERTEKIPMTSIKNVINEPIEGHEEYHIVGLQLGPTEASRYWIYWVPAQYVDALKEAILGPL